MAKYKLGDNWSADFDYEGMLDMAMKTSVDWSLEDLIKLSQSFTSVNYHTLNENLENAILEIKNQNKELAKEFLDEFHNEILKEKSDDDLELALSLAYPDIREICRRNGLILNESYYISDGGTEKYHPSILPLKDGKGNIQEISIGYFDYDENTIAFIRIDLKEKEAYLDSDFWEIEDADKLSIGYKKGGDVEDRGIRPSPKESATIFKAGTRKRGQDGNMWVVSVAKNGVKRWKKIDGGSKKEPRERKPMPPKSKPKKTDKKETESLEKSIEDYDEEYQVLLKILEEEIPDKEKVKKIKNKIGDFLMFYDLPLIEDYYGYLWNNVNYIPFNAISYKRASIGNKYDVSFLTFNKQARIINEKVLKFNTTGFRFLNQFIDKIENGSIQQDLYAENGVPEVIARVIFDYSTKDWHTMFVRDLYKRVNQGDFGHRWLEYVMSKEDEEEYLKKWRSDFDMSEDGEESKKSKKSKKSKYKVGDVFVVQPSYNHHKELKVGDKIEIIEVYLTGSFTEYELESKGAKKINFLNWTDEDIDTMLSDSKWKILSKEKSSEKPKEIKLEKTGINDWILDIEDGYKDGDEDFLDKAQNIPNIAAWKLIRNGIELEWHKVNDLGQGIDVGGYVKATPDYKNNITEIKFDNLNKVIIVKSLKTGTFKNLQEYVDEVSPTLYKLNNILRFDDGGEVHDGNLYMLKNQAVQFKHHAEELDEALEKEPKIDAWVVAKAERAATDLSDITHYLDGKTEKYARGGGVDRQEMLEKELRRLQRELNSPRLNRYIQADDSEEQKERFREREIKLARFNEILDLLRKMGKYADGGDILDQDTLSRIDNADLADASAYKYGGEIRSKEEIKKLYKDKVNYVKTLNPEQVVKSWNRNSWGVVHGYQEPIKYGEYKPELRMYLANLLFELELTEEEYKAYLKSGGYVRKTPATFKDKVRAISKRLVGTQVSPKYRSEYGATYDKNESLQAARKIAGKMIQKEKND